MAKNTFKAAVEATPDVANCLQPGLQALARNSSKIKLARQQDCEGSIDIDSCTKAKHKGDSRWDYAIGYRSRVHFVEVHTANTAEVGAVLKKLDWLKNWLSHHAPELKKLTAATNGFVWIQSGDYTILKGSSQARRIAQAGLRPMKSLKLG